MYSIVLAILLGTTAACTGTARSGVRVALGFEALDGGSIDLRRYRGRPVVLHLFTTWSLASQRDVAQLIDASTRHRDKLVVIGIALDPDGYRLVAPWRQANAVPYLIGLGSPQLVAGKSALGRIAQVPTTVILDRRGAISARVEGPLAEGQLARLLADLASR